MTKEIIDACRAYSAEVRKPRDFSLSMDEL